IMGGASTEVTEATHRVILESAVFHGPTIRNTARRLALRSEASMRHEKGIGAELPRMAADRAARLLVEITGARVGGGIVDNAPEPRPHGRVDVDLPRLGRLLGMPVTADQVRSLLEPLEFEVEGNEPTLSIGVPSHRLDVTVAADVAEEVARAYGYDRIEGRLPEAALPPFRPDPSGPRHALRRILAGLGIDEMVGHALIGPDDLLRTGYDADAPELVRLYNPLSEDHSILRPVLYPSLLGGVAENARRRRPDAWLFDLGKVYWGRDGTPSPRDRSAETAGTGRYEAWEVGIVLAGSPVPATAGSEARPADVSAIKGIVDALHDAIGAPRPSYRAEDPGARHPHRHPGRTGLICDAEGRPYGSLGEVHPRVVRAWGLSGRPVDAAIDLNRLLALVPAGGTVRTPPSAQPVDRDLAVVVDDGTPVGEVLRVARMSAGPLLDEQHLFDVYRGDQIGPGRVSYAIAFRFQPAEAGDEKAVDRAMNKVRGSLKHHLGAEIR
ncbi:MAG: phenylalanine--tRNA ligase subunit beta, partial [Chloroflexota bacterium]|nr:phenylalanine--tRNA ligase subunit beta [Chloroflexota bacterium]